MNKTVASLWWKILEDSTNIEFQTIWWVITITNRLLNSLLSNLTPDLFINPSESWLFRIIDTHGQNVNLALATESYLNNTGMSIWIKPWAKPLVIWDIEWESIYIISTKLTKLRVLNILTAVYELKNVKGKL